MAFLRLPAKMETKQAQDRARRLPEQSSGRAQAGGEARAGPTTVGKGRSSG
jgi:hypothetical protein